MNYYNEYDSAAAQWLRNLIAAGYLPAGDVDERSIEDVRPADLAGYVQCHFFAGIAGWPLALALAGWPADRPVWTGSCPCQPFSAAGKGDGFEDERHLWPAWQHLISQCRPAIIFGEQVASPAALQWIDLVSADLENAGYAVGAADLCGASVGAPHIRQRLYWVGHAIGAGLERHAGHGDDEAGRPQQAGPAAATGDAGGLVDSLRWRQQEGHSGHAEDRLHVTEVRTTVGSSEGGLADANGGNASTERQQRGGQHGQQSADSGVVRRADSGPQAEPAGAMGRTSAVHGGWADADWLRCRDGKWRPVEPGTFPLADGIPGRVVRLRAYGNAIVPQVAAEFVRAYMEARGVQFVEMAA